MNRYSRSRVIQAGKGLSTNLTIPVIRRMKERGQIQTFEHILREGERMDHVAARFLGSSQLWWVIAVMSDIGWSLQVPPGTVLRIPTDVGQIAGVTL